MGCGTSKSLPPNEDSRPLGRKGKMVGKRSSPLIDIGRPVGGGESSVNKREAQLAAAERRAAAEANRGLAVRSTKGLELGAAAQKQEIIGKISAYYQGQSREVPMGLNLASVEQLRKHLETVGRKSL